MFMYERRNAGLVLSWLAALALLLAACGGTASTPPSEPSTATDSANPTVEEIVEDIDDRCVETYDPEVDYFPQKLSLDYATGWTIAYFNHYKVVRVLEPWRGADVTFEYVLVQCGTPVPEGFEEAQIIEVPVDTVVTMAAPYVAYLDKLDALDYLVGVDNANYIYAPEVRGMFDAGELAEIGSGAEINIERALALEPDLIITNSIGDPQSDVHARLQEAGLHVAVSGDYMEVSPLGRAEWIKFAAALLNREARAEVLFEGAAASYNDLSASVRDVESQPTVFTGAPFQGTWYMAGGDSYIAQFLDDAGSAYLWAEDDTVGSLSLSFEAVFERAANADFWINTGTWSSMDEALAADERFGEFAALQNGNMYNNNARTTPFGGNDFWESGAANPQLILADLVAIFHPDILPDHELYFYQQVQ